jgi:large conductance mechanosensitive channel
VIGAAFGKVIDSFVAAFINPLIKAVTGGDAISGRTRLVNDVFIDWGAFISAVITFLLTAAAIYFVVVLPINKLSQLRRAGKAPEPEAPSDEVRLLTEIRDALRANSTPQQNPGS